MQLMQATIQPQSKMKTTNMKTLPNKKIDRSSLLQRRFALIPLALACSMLSPVSQAVSPPPDGGYANGNTAEGTNALFSLTTGTKNTANGYLALFSNTSGYDNTAIGSQTLYTNTTGSYNTAVGFDALFYNTNGYFNTATGYLALFKNTIGGGNTATGTYALQNNTTGVSNTATGDTVLYRNTSGYENTAAGWLALYANTTGGSNTANGVFALESNTIGNNNTAAGSAALTGNTTGNNNTASGTSALARNTTGGLNTATGSQALQNNTTGSNNIALGNLAGSNLTTGNYNIDIGNEGLPSEANTIRIGDNIHQSATFVAAVYDAPVAGLTVAIDASDHVGTVSSSRRFKDEIKPMDKVSEAVLALEPVVFRYKKQIDPGGIPQFGLVAEEVEKVDPALIIRGRDGRPYSVRYDAVNAMLLNEFLKEHRRVEQQSHKIQEQEATITELKKDFQSKLAEQQNRINALASGLEKVTAQLDLSKAAPRTVLNGR
jgi:Chaperone of endosialidase